MSKWKEYNLGDIGSFTNGINKDKNSFGFGFPFINLMDIFDKDIIYQKPLGLVNVTQDELTRYSIKEGDILFVRSSVKLEGVGKVCAVANTLENTTYSGFIIRFRQVELFIDKIFASYYLNSPHIRRQVISKATLSANSNINQESLKSIKIQIPEIERQQQIAKILFSTDSVIEQTQSAISKYKAIKQGLLHDLFTRGLGADGKLRPNYQDAPELYKETELGWIPREWEVKKSYDVVRFINGRAYSINEWETYGTPVIRLQNLTGSGENYYYSNLKLPDNQYCENGDLLYMWSASFGPHIWKGNKAIFHYHIWKVECSKGVLQAYFYYDLLKFTQTVLNGANGSTMAHITKEKMDKRLIITPSIQEQTEIVKIISSLENRLKIEENLLQKYQLVKRGLMGDLLGGKKEVK